MDLTIRLPDDLGRTLIAEADRRGLSAEEYLLRVLRKDLDASRPACESDRPFHETATIEEWLREFDRITREFPKTDAPPIPEEALRRENLYEDRGLEDPD